MIHFDQPSHTYRAGGERVISVTQAISAAGLVDGRWFDDYSRDRGTAVHLACELWDKGTLDEDVLDPVIVPYLDGWRLFTAETGAVWDMTGIEQMVHSQVYRFAGKLDRIGTVNSRRTLVDIKTGIPQPWTALQLAAYAGAMGELICRMAVHLPGDGKYRITSYKMADQVRDFAVFHACLTVANWKESNR